MKIIYIIKIYIACAISMLFALNLNAQIIRYVTPVGAGFKNGISWANAYDDTHLQKAINETGVQQVWVAAGTYKPTLEVGGTGSRYRAFQMKNGVSIYGGFAGNETSLSQRNYTTNITILSGDIDGNDIITGSGASLSISNNSENCYHVFNHPSSLGLTSLAVLDGFTIKCGNANNSLYPDSYGGGMFNQSCSPTINNVTILYSFATDGGGGMFNFFSSPMLNNVNISNNLTITGTGAGIDNYSSAPTITNALISNNSSNNIGGGIYNSNNSSPSFNNVTIANNSALYNGGGVYNYSSTSFLNNCIVWGNTSTSSNNGKQFYIYFGSAILNYCCYSNGSGDVTYTGSVFNASNNNITTNPQFANASTNDFRILGSSPCCDLGNDSYNTLTTDIRGTNFGRKLNKYNGNLVGTIDIGAYEFKFGSDPYGICLNPSSGGIISASQSICTGNTPNGLINVSLPTGNTVPLEYKWQVSTTSAATGFIDIPSSNSIAFTPGVLSVTTWYKRLARVICKADWVAAAESNVIEITVNPYPTANIINNSGTTVLTCTNTSINLIVSGGGNYLWDNNSVNANRTIALAGTYSLTVTTNECSSSASINITSNTTAPTLSLSHHNISCYGTSDGSIDLTVLSGTAPYTYNWINTKPCAGNSDCSFMGAGSYCQSGYCHGINEDLTNLPVDTYIVTVTGANGCSGTASQSIAATPLPDASIQATNSPVCSGNTASFTLTGTNGAIVTYSINGGANTTIPLAGGIATISINNVQVNQTLSLISVTDTNCSKSLNAIATILVNQSPIINILSTNSPVCSGLNANFSINGTSGATITYNINGGASTSLLLTGSPQSITINNITTSQTLNIFNITNGTCPQNISTTASVLLDPNPIITGSPNNGYVVHCGDINQYCTPFVAGHLYSWSAFGNVSYSTPNLKNCITDQFINPCGVYGAWTISVTETNPSNGCTSTASKSIFIQQP